MGSREISGLRTAGAIAGLGVVLASPWGLGCRKNPSVTFDVTVPSGVLGDVTWFEIGAFRDASCGAVRPQITGGIPLDGSAVRVAFKKGSPTPEIGDLAKAKYAFAAVAKKDDCTVIAQGCTDTDVSSDRSITVNLSPTEAGLGACGKGEICATARCVSAKDNKDPAVGAGCSLQLLGAGPLANPLAAGALLSAPAITPIEGGFIVVYKEVDPSNGYARQVIVPVDASGGVYKGVTLQLADRCTGSEETGATALASTATGNAVMNTRAPCIGNKNKAAIDYLPLDPAGNVVDYKRSEFDSVLEFSRAHALATVPGTQNGFLTFTAVRTDGTVAPYVIPMTDILRQGAPTAPSAVQFVCAPHSTGAMVAATADLTVLGWTGPDTTTPFVDAGAPPEGGVVDSGVVKDSGPAAETTVARLVMLRRGSTLDPAWCASAPGPATRVAVPATWASLAAVGKRAILLTSGPTPARPVRYTLFDLDKDTPTPDEGYYSPQGSVLSKALFADVAVAQDRMFIAVERPGDVTLVAYDNVSTAPAQLAEVVLARDPRVPSLLGLRDGLLAVSATSSRVAVAWTTGSVLGPNDAAGGYAVLACTK